MAVVQRRSVRLGLPAALGNIQQPFNLRRLRRYVQRPEYLGGLPPPETPLGLAPDWGRRVGQRLDNTSAKELAEFCIGHSLVFYLPKDYYPPHHADYPYTGPRRVRAYDSLKERGTPLQQAVYLLDQPIADNVDGHEFVTGLLPLLAPAHIPANMNWSVIRALKFTFPGANILKDLLLDADRTVVFRNSQFPIHMVVAARMSGGRNPER